MSYASLILYVKFEKMLTELSLMRCLMAVGCLVLVFVGGFLEHSGFCNSEVVFERFSSAGAAARITTVLSCTKRGLKSDGQLKLKSLLE